MAICNIRKYGDDILTKKCRKVTEITPRIIRLLDDLAETMNSAGGVGLAACQVGVLRAVCVIDMGDGLVELINPEIVEASEEMVTEAEGCLSLPGKYVQTLRPKKVKVMAKDRSFKDVEIVGEDFFARALCHEIDHLNGIFFAGPDAEFLTEEDFEKEDKE